jgi:predicted aspartyl protease
MRRRIRTPERACLKICLIAVLAATAARECDARPAQSVASRKVVQRIAFLYEDARLYVPVSVGGAPAVWFILDTGASETILDLATARRLGLAVSGKRLVQGAGAGGSVQGDAGTVRLRVGSVPLTVQARVLDLAGLLGPTSGRAPAGIIGSQFFREHFVAIDFRARTILLFPPGADLRSRYEASIPLTLSGGVPLVPVRLTLPDGHEMTADALVDLGAKSTFLVSEPAIQRADLRGAFPNAVTTAFGAGVGGDTFYAFARAERLSFAAARDIGLDRPVVGLSVRGTLRSSFPEALLGAEFLSRFAVGFDYARSRLLLSRASIDEVTPFDRSGLFLVATGNALDQIVVRQVLDGGPGALAGLRPGDLLTAIDGRPTGPQGLAAVRALLKRPDRDRVSISYRRSGTLFEAQLTLRDLI